MFKLLRLYDERLRDIGLGFPSRRWILYHFLSMIAPVLAAVFASRVWMRHSPAITVTSLILCIGVWMLFYSKAQKARRSEFKKKRFLNAEDLSGCIQEKQVGILQDWLRTEGWFSLAAVAQLSSGVDLELAEHRRTHLAGLKGVPLFLGIFLSGVSAAILARVPEAEFDRAAADIGRLLAWCAVLACLIVTTLDAFDVRGYKLFGLKRMLTGSALELLRAPSPAGPGAAEVGAAGRHGEESSVPKSSPSGGARKPCDVVVQQAWSEAPRPQSSHHHQS